MVSLRTRRFREAEHLAAVADLAFASAWKRAVSGTIDDADLKRALHEYIRRELDDDLRRRLAAPPGKPVYVRDWDGELPAAHADLEAVEDAIDSVQEDLIERDFTRVMDEIDHLIATHRLLGDVHQRLALGVL